MPEDSAAHELPRIVVIGGENFIRFLDHDGRPRTVNVKNVNGWSPDNENPGWTVIFTAGAAHKMPMRSPFPVESFDKLDATVPVRGHEDEP